ncbi:hypothetical protein HN011_010140 [Eciton burchellii]|nr:hypothetical protein HN011_010140 [Eciton burchellii]
MDKLKHYMSLVDTHWIVVVATGMYTHLREVCIIGLCNDNDVPFHQSYASVLFVFSVLCLLAEYRLWPISLKEPPIQVLYIYEMMLAVLSTNLAMTLIWVPLMQTVYCLTQQSSILLNYVLGWEESFILLFAEYMAEDIAATYMALCISLLSFVWMLDATESLDTILDTWCK